MDYNHNNICIDYNGFFEGLLVNFAKFASYLISCLVQLLRITFHQLKFYLSFYNCTFQILYFFNTAV